MTSDKSINDILSSVLENKDLMSKISGIVAENKTGNAEDALPNIVSAISEEMGSVHPNDDTKSDDGGNINVKEASSFLSKVKNTGESVALLKAIKPFLCKERCEIIDNIVKLERLTKLTDLMR